MFLDTLLNGLNVLSHFLYSNTLPRELRRSQYDYKSECRTGLKDHSECLMHCCIYTPLQPMNIDPPKLESVPEGSQPAIKRVGSSTSVSGKRNKAKSVWEFLKPLGLRGYSFIFEDEDIDMPRLASMTDEDLKKKGLPKMKLVGKLWSTFLEALQNHPNHPSSRQSTRDQERRYFWH
ncbi:uncharacterized protein LOC132269629 [Cornus florida]|uniref:uncharacterized protein LOC132269629 n=1 Tax=Cornus florida TaxID=4283 RepID=UPI00289705D3|nr:uncharacterized protein LOC132269629 [Cornus florida]